MKLSDFIKNARADLGLTQVEFAKKIKMKQSTISGWENETRALSMSSSRKLKKFCEQNNINISAEVFS